MKFKGDSLELNCFTQGDGYILTEILDENLNPISGLTLIDSDVVKGDGIAKQVSWKGIRNISKLKNQVIALRIVMKKAKLFAFQFTWNEKTNVTGVINLLLND